MQVSPSSRARRQPPLMISLVEQSLQIMPCFTANLSLSLSTCDPPSLHSALLIDFGALLLLSPLSSVALFSVFLFIFCYSHCQIEYVKKERLKRWMYRPYIATLFFGYSDNALTFTGPELPRYPLI